MSTETETMEVQIAEQASMALVGALSRAELDHAITTARAFPRSLKRFVDECREMACLNEKVASECFYVLPRGGKNIEGPSVRLGEIVMSAWGNCQSGARVVEEGQDFITAQGVFYDLQRNVKITMEVRRRITGKNNRRYDADMIGVTGNAACSIALRNAIFRGIPKAFWQDIYEDARAVAKGNIKSLVTNRTAALDWLARRGVPQQMVIDALGVAGIEDIGLEELVTLKGMMTTVKDGEATVETVFAPKNAPEAQPGKPKTDAPKSKKQAEAEAAEATAKAAADAKSAEDAAKAAATAAAETKVETTVTETVKTAETVATHNPNGFTVDQIQAVKDKLNEEGIAESLLLAKFEVGSLAEIDKGRYKIVNNWINAASAAGAK